MTNPIDAWEYTFEIQLGWFPGSGWMRAPYFRDSWSSAFKEARQYAEFGARNGHMVLGACAAHRPHHRQANPDRLGERTSI